MPTATGLRGDYLEKLSRGCFKKREFKGVFACDEFAKMKKLHKGDKFICNLASSNRKGIHWISIYVGENSIIYFDPLGIPCHDMYILKMMEKSKKKIHTSNYKIQSFTSHFCGFFALSFLIICENYCSPLKQVKKIFNEKDFLKNEKISIDIITQQLK